MARFSGIIGFQQVTESSPGFFDDFSIVERKYKGEIIRNHFSYQATQELHDDIQLQISIKIISDNFAIDNFHLIKYVIFNGVKWKVTSVEIERPHITLQLGGVYNGS